MKVRARHWLNYNGTWYKGGDEFDVDDIEEVKAYVDPLVDMPVVHVSDMKTTPKRGRPKKTEG